jgi:hypothetical protein
MLYPRSGCTISVPVNVPSECGFHEPSLSAMALPMPPMVSPVESFALLGMRPKATMPCTTTFSFFTALKLIGEH